MSRWQISDHFASIIKHKANYERFLRTQIWVFQVSEKTENYEQILKWQDLKFRHVAAIWAMKNWANSKTAATFW